MSAQLLAKGDQAARAFGYDEEDPQYWQFMATSLLIGVPMCYDDDKGGVCVWVGGNAQFGGPSNNSTNNDTNYTNSSYTSNLSITIPYQESIQIPKTNMLLGLQTTPNQQIEQTQEASSDYPFLNPTGGSLRGKDRWGSGEYGAPRINYKTGKRYRHPGIDILGKVGAIVYAPMSGYMKYCGKDQFAGAAIYGGNSYTVRVLHVNMTSPQGYVNRGDKIGTVMDLRKWYGPGMPSHVHFELYQENTNIDPTGYIYLP